MSGSFISATYHDARRLGRSGVLAIAMVVLVASSPRAEGPTDTGLRLPNCPVVEAPEIHLPKVWAATPLDVPVFDRIDPLESAPFFGAESSLQQAAMLQPTPFLEPRATVSPSVSTSSQTNSLTSRLFGATGIDRSVLRQARLGSRSLRVDVVEGQEAAPLVSTDIGSLLRKSKRALSVETQQRTPLVNDPRIRSSRVGALAASGSHWVPARADLDTALNKIDSRLISDVVIVPGPYSSVYGPDFHFIDFELLPSPRYEDRQWRGGTSFNHQANGNQWLGQQGFSGGSNDWGVRFNYSHRYGDNYRDGNGDPVQSAYESREFTFGAGRDFGDSRSIEFSLLRLDQTDVEFPGYVFDIDFLATDGYEIAYVDDEARLADRSETELWYNRTRFDGNAQNPAKRQQFPLLERIDYVGFTDVDSMSTGYRHALTWGGEAYRLTVGHDLRFIKQELNEISSGISRGFPIPFTDRNSPIPRSFSVNPGLFLEYVEPLGNGLTFRSGARLDYVQTDIVEDFQNLQEVGLNTLPASYTEIVGTDKSQTDRMLGSMYGTLERRHNACLSSSCSLGYAQRPPNLTELYAAQPFLLLLQNGLNNVTGDPLLESEQLLQTDFTIDFDGDNVRCGLRGFYGWYFDYITFENTNVVLGPPNAEVQQVSLRYVNTDRATMAGFESYLEWMPSRRLSPFGTLRYVEGTDRTRNGDFATTNGRSGAASTKVFGLPRGFFSGVAGSGSEPLPGISPLETRLGVRLKNAGPQPLWNVELAARIVDDQSRVAASLLESATPGFTVFDLRGTYQPPGRTGFAIVAGVENFTDKVYREHLDFRAPNGTRVLRPGANAYFGVDRRY